MRKHRDPCGCSHDGARWIDLCATHGAEAAAVHDRAKADHRARRAALDAERERREYLEDLNLA
jgi:hypothetical protein